MRAGPDGSVYYRTYLLLVSFISHTNAQLICLGDLSPQAGYLTEQIMSLPETKRPEMPLFEIKEYIPLIDSSLMGPDHWAEITEDISANYFDYDGFVVIMGTGLFPNWLSFLTYF